MASTVSSWGFNGERAVVLLFIARVLFSLPPALLLHGLALSLLSLSAVFAEISADTSSSLSLLRTRPGASSGILLGAVTLPAVMLSKLIQLSRALTLNEVAIEELEYQTLQYWATCACSLSVLVFLCIFILRAPENMHPACSRVGQNAALSLSGIALYALICGLSLATTSHTGFDTFLKLFWVLCHGLAAVKLILHFLRTFPSCASIGEALLVTGGLTLYFGDMLACTIVRVIGFLSWSDLVPIQYGIKRSEITIIIQGLLLGLLLLPMVFKYVLHVWECFSSRANAEAGRCHEIGRSVIFFASLGFILMVILPLWMQFVQDFDLHPLVWYYFSINIILN